MRNGTFKQIAKEWCPPAIASFARVGLARLGLVAQSTLRGPFPDWESAARASTGYDADVILERVTAAVQAVLDGRAAYERDSVTFEQILWPWPLLAALAREAARHDGELRVLDFGGSLGGTYLVARRFFGDSVRMQWRVVEQPHYATRGAQLNLPGAIQFFDAIEPAARSAAPNVVIASGVLQCLREPLATLRELAMLGADAILVDRSPCVDGADDILTVQDVPASIFPASYPLWLFASHRITAALQGTYRSVAEFESDDWLSFQGRTVAFRGWYLERCGS
jgi:putative methyltransferase (TIGR04325 family)